LSHLFFQLLAPLAHYRYQLGWVAVVGVQLLKKFEVVLSEGAGALLGQFGALAPQL
jgi:hypothetical protein